MDIDKISFNLVCDKKIIKELVKDCLSETLKEVIYSNQNHNQTNSYKDLKVNNRKGININYKKNFDLDNDDIISHNQELKEENKRLKVEIEKLNEKILEIEKKRREKLDLIANKNSSIIENLNKQIGELQSELAERFTEGKKIYDQLNSIDKKYIDKLQAYLGYKNFESFILSSSMNTESLEKIWLVSREAIKNRDFSDAEILWSYFLYMVKLFNYTKNEEVIRIDKVCKNDRYNVYEHEDIDGLVKNGYITKVYLQGFVNAYLNERKGNAIVSVK